MKIYVKSFALVFSLSIVVFYACSFGPKPAENIKLPAIFGDNMVMQQKTKVPIWGEASPGGQVIVQIAGLEAAAVADENGNWKTAINSPKAGGPYELKIMV